MKKSEIILLQSLLIQPYNKIVSAPIKSSQTLALWPTVRNMENPTALNRIIHHTAKLQFAPLAGQYIWLDFLLSLIEVPQLRWRSSIRRIKRPSTGLRTHPDVGQNSSNNSCNSNNCNSTWLSDLGHMFFTLSTKPYHSCL